jgi:hypothetical protein
VGLRGERGVQAVEAQPVARLDAIVIGGVVEFQRQDAEVGEVLPVDAGIGLGEDGAQAEIPQGDRGVFTGGALAPVLAGDDQVTSVVAEVGGAAGVVGVEPGESELGEFGDVGAVRQGLGAGREISSVETWSPALNRTGASRVSGSGSRSGSGEMLGPRSRRTRAASPAGRGGSSMAVLTAALLGSCTSR